jgi:hypothetical protein
MTEPFFDTRDEKTIELQMDYFNSFETESGKRVIADLAKFCLESRDIFVVDSARKTDYNLGANAVIRYIRNKLIRKEPKPVKTIN